MSIGQAISVFLIQAFFFSCSDKSASSAQNPGDGESEVRPSPVEPTPLPPTPPPLPPTPVVRGWPYKFNSHLLRELRSDTLTVLGSRPAAASKPFKKVVRLCRGNNTSMVVASRECRCTLPGLSALSDPGSFFNAKYSHINDDNPCVPLLVENRSYCFDHYSVDEWPDLDVAAINQCFADFLHAPSYRGESFSGSIISMIASDNLKRHEKRFLGEWSEQFRSDSVAGLTHPFRLFVGAQNGRVNIHLKRKELTHEILRGMFFPEFYLSTSKVNASFGSRFDVWESDVQHLPFLMGKALTDQDQRRYFPEPPRSLPESIKILHENYKELAAEIEFDESRMDVRVLAGEGCDDACVARYSPQDGSSGYVEVLYIGGSIAKKVYYQKDHQGNLVGAIAFDMNLMPNGYLSFDYQMTRDRSLVANLKFYDRKWKSYPVKPFVLGKKVHELQSLLSQVGDFRDAASGSILLNHETASSSHVDKIVDNIAVGPYRGQTFLGLLPTGNNYSDRMFGFISPLPSGLSIGTTEFGLEPEYYSHGYHVARAAIATYGNIKILPIGNFGPHEQVWRRLLADPEIFPESYAEQKIKVVNVSKIAWSSANTCSYMHGEAVYQSREKLLWVFGAGNDGKVDSPYCPQFMNWPNALVVAAYDKNPSRLARYSNYGPRYADIAADGNIGDQSGTSFASPRVAACAVRLAQYFPGLTPIDLRQVFLVAARIPKGFGSWTLNPLPVRSGGYLDESAAFKIAKCFASLKGHHELTFLGKRAALFCLGQAGFSKQYSEKKVALLQKNDGFAADF